MEIKEEQVNKQQPIWVKILLSNLEGEKDKDDSNN